MNAFFQMIGGCVRKSADGEAKSLRIRLRFCSCVRKNAAPGPNSCEFGYTEGTP